MSGTPADPLRRTLLRLAACAALGPLDALAARSRRAVRRVGYFPPRDDRQDPYVTAGIGAAVLGHARRTCQIIGGAAFEAAPGGGTRLHHQRYGSFNALCASEPFGDQSTVLELRAGAYGTFGYTGYLIGPQTVLTCRHGWEDAGDEPQFALFDYALRGDGTPPTDLPAGRTVRLLARPVATAPPDERGDPGAGDWIVLRLEHRIEHLGQVAPARLAAPRLGGAVYTLGYPRGLPLKLAANARVRALAPDTFRADLDTYVGNSGSPVFDAASQALVGLIVAAQPGEGDFDASPARGCYVSHRVARRGEGQLAVSACSFSGALTADRE